MWKELLLYQRDTVPARADDFRYRKINPIAFACQVILKTIFNTVLYPEQAFSVIYPINHCDVSK